MGLFGHVIKLALIRALDSSLDVDSLQISSSLPSFGTPRQVLLYTEIQ